MRVSCGKGSHVYSSLLYDRAAALGVDMRNYRAIEPIEADLDSAVNLQLTNAAGEIIF